MPALLIFLCTSLVAMGAVSEGFIREKKGKFVLEDSLDPKLPVPDRGACEPLRLKKLLNVYVRLDWEQVPGKDCFAIRSLQPIVYDPLRNSRVIKGK